MKKDTVLVAVCNQKGGVGKSTMTIMLAGYYHYLKGLNVAVIDCDYPQYSLVRMKERDMRTVENEIPVRTYPEESLYDCRLKSGKCP